MSKSSNYRGLDVFALDSPSLYRWLDTQDDGWKELPDDREFARLETKPRRKRFSRIRQHLRSIIAKRRRYA